MQDESKPPVAISRTATEALKPNDTIDKVNNEIDLINELGSIVETRILTPDGYKRLVTPDDSFADYLRKLPIKPAGSKVRSFNGALCDTGNNVAVLDIDVGSRDLQQCADSIMRLRAEYLFGIQQYDRIHFNFTNGFNAEFAKWIKGYGISIIGNNTSWIRKEENNSSYKSFRQYLNLVFTYAGTLSLSKELEKVSMEKMQMGDVFIKGGTPGHAVIVLDMAENLDGDRVFLLAQGYMPAQDMHILINPVDDELSPWYRLNPSMDLVTPDWRFTNNQLMRFKD